MKGNFPTYQDDEAFRRIAVMLLDLAACAEEAARRSWPVRCLVLWLLRPAEKAARAYAIEAGAPLLVLDGYFDHGRGDGEAARLARILEALAAFFFDLSSQAAQLIYTAGQARGCLPAGGHNAARPYPLIPASWRLCPDTS